MNIGILILSFETSEFWRYFYNCWNSDLILSNIGILALFSSVCLLQSGCAGPINYHVFPPGTLASLGILRNVGILALFLIVSFQTLEFWLSFIHIGFLILCFQTTGSWSYFY